MDQPSNNPPKQLQPMPPPQQPNLPSPLDPLEMAMGEVPALLTRLLISGLTSLAASKGFGWLGSVTPAEAVTIQAVVTAGLHSGAEALRTKYPSLGWLPF